MGRDKQLYYIITVLILGMAATGCEKLQFLNSIHPKDISEVPKMPSDEDSDVPPAPGDNPSEPNEPDQPDEPLPDIKLSTIESLDTAQADGVSQASVKICLKDSQGLPVVGVQPVITHTSPTPIAGECSESDNEGISYCLTGSQTVGEFDLMITYPQTVVGESVEFTEVVGSPPKYVSIETAADGTGSILGDVANHDGAPISVYAIGRDADDNFHSLVNVQWHLANKNARLSQKTGGETVIYGSSNTSSTQLVVTHPVLGIDLTGNIDFTWTVEQKNPNDLKLWLKADAANAPDQASLTYLANLSTKTPPAAGASVCAGQEGPTYLADGGNELNNYPTLSFSETDCLTLGTGWKYNAYTVFTVVTNSNEIQNETDQYPIWSIGQTARTFGLMFGGAYGGTGANTVMQSYATKDAVEEVAFDDNGTVAADTTRVVTTRWVGNQMRMYVNKTSIDTDNKSVKPSHILNTSEFLIQGLDGKISELILYKRGLNNSARSAIETYLCNKYDVSC